jgi:hypothetical protein
MNVGVTGTRVGMTDAQRGTFGELMILDLRATSFHHGSCQGADVEAARIVDHVYGDACKIICHPGPDGDPYKACSDIDNEIRPPKGHFARNRDIVDETDLLIVCPREMERQERGGTWYTYDYAKKKGKRVLVCWPDGSLTIANGPNV